ncbi:MAG: serine/threonine protein kinase [Myxococcota bacterium]|nr:serine/threonine protein kinase [Myxococcota bacterium]
MRPVTDSEELAALEVGRTLCGTWHLDALIDVGGMAAVYAATHRDGTRGAVKLLHGEVAANPEAASRFLREGMIASRVANHPNALRILDHDVDDDGTVFLVMELLEGGTLHRCAQAVGGTLRPREALLILDQLLDVLDSVHRAGIVHRDIKPENVFLTTDGEVKLLDFGIARMGEAVTVCEIESGSGRRGGSAMGSPVYMSPEQASGRWDLVDAQSDLWSVGATMFALLSGEPMHVEAASSDPLAGVGQHARSLASACPRLHSAVVDVVDRALHLERSQRWSDAADMRAAVHRAYVAITGDLLPWTPCKRTAPRAPKPMPERVFMAPSERRHGAPVHAAP